MSPCSKATRTSSLTSGSQTRPASGPAPGDGDPGPVRLDLVREPRVAELDPPHLGRVVVVGDDRHDDVRECAGRRRRRPAIRSRRRRGATGPGDRCTRDGCGTPPSPNSCRLRRDHPLALQCLVDAGHAHRGARPQVRRPQRNEAGLERRAADLLRLRGGECVGCCLACDRSVDHGHRLAADLVGEALGRLRLGQRRVRRLRLRPADDRRLLLDVPAADLHLGDLRHGADPAAELLQVVVPDELDGSRGGRSHPEPGRPTVVGFP